MPVVMTQITGPVRVPNGDIPAYGRMTFKLRRVATAGTTTYIRETVESVLDAGGNLDVTLQASASLDLLTNYDVTVRYFSTAAKCTVTESLGVISVPVSGPVSFASLYTQAPDEPTPPDVLAEAVAAVEGATVAAGQSADSAAAAALSAAQAALYDGYRIDSVAGFSADTAMTYTAGQPGTVVAGNAVFATAEGLSLIVLASGAATYDAINANGVKLSIQSRAEYLPDFSPQSSNGILHEIARRAQGGEAFGIACYGDSSTLGVDEVEKSFNNWPNRLGSILRSMSGNPNVATYNGGSGGKKVIDDWAIDNYAAQITTPYPNSGYCILCFGLNDIKGDGGAPWDAGIFKEKYKILIDAVRASGRVPIIMTPWLISAQSLRPNPLMQGELLAVIEEIVSEYRLALIDTNKLQQDWQRDRTDQYRIGDYQPDGTHWSDQGHILIAQYIATQIFRHRVIDVSHGSKIGPQDAAFDPSVTVSYNYLMNNAWGYSARLTATENVNIAAHSWVWSDRERRVIYVSPDRSVVSGANSAYAYVGAIGSSHEELIEGVIEDVADEYGVKIDFGKAGVDTVNRPAESHIFVATLRAGLSRLRFRCAGAGEFEYGGFLIVDDYGEVATSAYSVAAVREVFLPAFDDSRPEIVPKLSSSTNILVDGNIPVGWGVVLSTQYAFQDAGDYGPSRRKTSIVALRTSTGADILRVLHDASGVFAALSIKTSGSGAWAGQISLHALVDGSGNAVIQVRADGTVIAVHTNDGSGVFQSPYGRLGGLYRDNALVADPAGRVAQATLMVMDRAQ